MIYTVGNEKNYDEGLILYGAEFKKAGRNGDYPGGFAVHTIEDGWRLVEEFKKVGEWAVYEIVAIWERDTSPSENGWWHGLQSDAVILRKVMDSMGNLI